jgi:Flp pilus assembly protein TadG
MVRGHPAPPEQTEQRDAQARTGTDLVEFALSLIVLPVISMGIFDLDRAFTTYIIITNAARESAYYGGLHPTDTAGIVSHVSQETQGSAITLTAENVAVSSSGVKGTPLRVTERYDFSPSVSSYPAYKQSGCSIPPRW